MDPHQWDERYRSHEQLFSGNPNGVLVTEAADLTPGRALDVGCGEGADALWLAARGWQVTAVDISRVALERAAVAGADLVERVTWTQADLTTTAPPAGAFDLVSLQYFPLPVQPEHTALRGLLDAVAPGGTLLIGSHDMTDLATYRHPDFNPDFNPDDYYQRDDVAPLLTDGWTVQVNESRQRTTPPPEGTHHVHDTVLRARRSR